jgi:hypothetical protein
MTLDVYPGQFDDDLADRLDATSKTAHGLRADSHPIDQASAPVRTTHSRVNYWARLVELRDSNPTPARLGGVWHIRGVR